jgi:hypothetical protein
MEVDDIPITDLIYFDLEYDSQPFGRLIVGLYGTVCESIFKIQRLYLKPLKTSNN